MNKYRRKVAAERRLPPGWASGYADYRYGVRRPITLAGCQPRPEPAISKDFRKQLVSKVTDLMRDWVHNRWEHEGSTREGLRRGLISRGAEWEPSDKEAAAIINDAFKKLGRGKETRPSSDEARDEFYIALENCLICYAPLDPDLISLGRRFCCVEHARIAYLRRVYAEGWHRSEFGMAAYRMLLRERNAPRICANPKCGREFKPEQENSPQRYCSLACKYEARRVDLGQRACALDGCEVRFSVTARNPGKLYCCREHSLAAKATTPLRECALEGCSNWFKPQHNNSREGGNRGLYCSRECADKARSTRVHRLVCQCCGDMFTAGVPQAKFCSDAHRQIYLKFAKGMPPKRFSPAVFDYLFRREREERIASSFRIELVFDRAPALISPETFDEIFGMAA